MNRTADDCVIDINNLSFSYENSPLLANVSLQVKRGEFIGVIGPNGGGKTTLLKLLMGFLQPNGGKISLFKRPPAAARLRIGYVPQVHRTDRDFPITLHELVLLGALSTVSFLGAYPPEIKEKALDLIEKLGLSPHKDQLFGSLSGGLAQRALLARALLSDPDLLLLDEPTANIDPPSSAAIFDLLSSFKGKKTVLFVTHDLRAVVERVDRILCVQGKIQILLPKDICEHFALGLYHTPLLGLPANHFQKEADCARCLH
jgi:zinc transport system ATP-binding protein